LIVLFSPVLLEAGNPSPMTGRGNNTYLIFGSNGAAALIDAGVGNPQHLAEVDRTLATARAHLDDVLVTHGHADHASGAPALAAAHPEARFAKYPWPEEDRRYGVIWHPLAEGDAVAIGDERIHVILAPGHSPDHLVFWHEPSRTAFTGDLVTVGSSVMIHWSRGGNLGDYLASLERLLALRPQRLLPAHGAEPGDPAALLSGYLEHRRMRERQVVAALEAGRSTVQAIAESIYDGLDPALMAAARENVRAHLEKLKSEGRAGVEADRWRICGERH
jgi:glyoxylase-like metal-dependent hydrolase (beta-lactamase superfamily II)